MTTEPNNTVKEEDLEREALVAKKRIELISLSLGDINKTLVQVHDILDANLLIKNVVSKIDVNLIINEENAESSSTKIKVKSDKAIIKKKEHPDKAIFTKKRNKLDNTPDRLWYKMFGMYFYIEFTIRNAKNDKNNLKGCFIYGVSYYIEKDKVEDKPILNFFIDNVNIIKASDDFAEESWTIKKEHIIDLHLRALDKIWEEALYLINKDKLQ